MTEPTETLLVGPEPPPASAYSDVSDQWSAVINCHGCNLAQIEAALATNQHEVDRNPADWRRGLRRHPVYLVAEDYTNLDAQGRPTPGAPSEVDLAVVRDVFSTRYTWVSAVGPPADGSHVRVAGMHYIAEMDSAGNPTGRVILGTPEV